MPAVIASTYAIIGEIGSGGGGTVYLAEHLRLGKKVVLKVDKRKITTSPELLRREVDVLKELRHRYIPQVYDFFVENDTVFTVMDYVDGESLDRVLKREGRVPQAQVLHWAVQLLEALSYLHSPTHGDPPRGYVHSDIKPANIMLRPDGDICLIDFNISLAIGEENVVGGSAGYASPEHYGLDYSFSSTSSGTETAADTETEYLGDRTLTLIKTPSTQKSSSSRKRIVVPDARSDIYSIGATLYHLLGGKKPAGRAVDVEPLSGEGISPRVAAIVKKAMEPNPDQRYQSADEMLRAIYDLWDKDSRKLGHKRAGRILAAAAALIFVAGGAVTFAGSYQNRQLKTAELLAEKSRTELQSGSRAGAIDYALQALPVDSGPFGIPYTAEAQSALTEALGVYDLSDSFKTCSRIELPSAPFGISVSPNEKYLIVRYAYKLGIYDLATSECINTFDTVDSASCGIDFLDDVTAVCALKDGVAAVNIETGEILWQNEPATYVAVSENKEMIAALYRLDETVYFYDKSGKLMSKRSLEGKSINAPENDRFADAGNRIFALNREGGWLAISLSDGSLLLLQPFDKYNDILVYEGSDYTDFTGGFCGKNFAYTASGKSGAVFGLLDLASDKFVGRMQLSGSVGVTVYGGGVYVRQKDTVIRFDTDGFTQTEIAYTENTDITGMSMSRKYVAAATSDGAYSVFVRGGALLQKTFPERPVDFIAATDAYLAVADRNTPEVEILKLKEYGDRVAISYDPAYVHSEARLRSDGSGAMLFSVKGFKIFNSDGSTKEVSLGGTGSIYDQQYRHDGGGDFLEVTYYDGKVVRYSAADGSVLGETAIEPPDEGLGETFVTDDLRVESPLHGPAEVYRISDGKRIAELPEGGYLTYFQQAGKYYVAQYLTTDGGQYGLLLNSELKTLARLPELCDIVGETLVFDSPAGNLKTSKIYELDELRETALSRN